MYRLMLSVYIHTCTYMHANINTYPSMSFYILKLHIGIYRPMTIHAYIHISYMHTYVYL